MITLDDLTWADGLVFDDLNDSIVTAYTQQGNLSIAIAPASSQSYVGIYEQPLDVELRFNFSAMQEYLLPTAANAYTQQGNLTVQFVMPAGQEHVAVLAGTFGQTGNLSVRFDISSFQQHFGGALPGEYLQQGALPVAFSVAAAQVWNPTAIGVSGYVSLASIGGYAQTDAALASVTLNQSLPSVNEVHVELICEDSDWLAGVGPNGGLLAVSVEVQWGVEWLPIVSLSNARSHATVIDGSAFSALSAGVELGQLELRLGGFEALNDRVVPRQLYGTSTLAVEAFT